MVRRVLISIVLWTLMLRPLCAQLQLGSYTLYSAPAPTLRDPTHLSIGVGTQRMLAGIGGVAFDQIAEPADKLRIGTPLLKWDPSAVDGARLSVIHDAGRYVVPLRDWQLVPIARYADSDFYSAVTLFGTLDDRKQEKSVREKGGDIINYHPALVDTLMGLRIFQFDVLILEISSTDLPKDKGRYVLGSGETPPDLIVNGMGWNRFMDHIGGVESALGLSLRSYLICDHARPVRFAVQDGMVTPSGDPLYYCWRYKSDAPGYDREDAGRKILSGLNARMKSERAAKREKFSEREFYVAELLKQAAVYQERFSFYSSGTVVDLIGRREGEERIQFLQRYSTDSLRRMLVDMLAGMDAYEVVFLEEYSERLSSRPDILRSINPQVWDAGTNLMRWSAFFRWVKRDYPTEWQRFLKQIEGAVIEPKLKTPTIRMPRRARA